MAGEVNRLARSVGSYACRRWARLHCESAIQGATTCRIPSRVTPLRSRFWPEGSAQTGEAKSVFAVPKSIIAISLPAPTPGFSRDGSSLAGPRAASSNRRTVEGSGGSGDCLGATTDDDRLIWLDCLEFTVPLGVDASLVPSLR